MEAIYRRTPLITTTHWNQAFLVLYVWQIQTQMITQIKQKNEHYCDVEDAGRNVILRNMRKLNTKTKNKRFEPFPLKIRPNKTSDTGSGNTWPRHNFITQSVTDWQSDETREKTSKTISKDKTSLILHKSCTKIYSQDGFKRFFLLLMESCIRQRTYNEACEDKMSEPWTWQKAAITQHKVFFRLYSVQYFPYPCFDKLNSSVIGQSNCNLLRCEMTDSRKLVN